MFILYKNVLSKILKNYNYRNKNCRNKNYRNKPKKSEFKEDKYNFHIKSTLISILIDFFLKSYQSIYEKIF